MSSPRPAARTISRPVQLRSSHAHALALAMIASLATATGCSPTPAELCDHVMEVLAADKGVEIANEADKTAAREACIDDVEREKSQLEGVREYNTRAKCIMRADSIAAMSSCDEDEG